jgi:Kdo2-lipid A phosphotransferase
VFLVTTKNWHWILLLLLCLFVVFRLPHPQSIVLAYDLSSARWLNELLGHNRPLDLAVATINSQRGDLLMALGISLLFLNHIRRTPTLHELYRRLAFWTWVGLLFVFVFYFQQWIEEIVERESPSRVMEGWKNLKEIYGLPVKINNKDSFPSGHAAAYFFFAFMSLRRYPSMGYVFLTLAIILPPTRVMTGAHWLTDIYLGSLPLALLTSAIAYETRIYCSLSYLEAFYEKCGANIRRFAIRS